MVTVTGKNYTGITVGKPNGETTLIMFSGRCRSQMLMLAAIRLEQVFPSKRVPLYVNLMILRLWSILLRVLDMIPLRLSATTLVSLRPPVPSNLWNANRILTCPVSAEWFYALNVVCVDVIVVPMLLMDVKLMAPATRLAVGLQMLLRCRVGLL